MKKTGFIFLASLFLSIFLAGCGSTNKLGDLSTYSTDNYETEWKDVENFQNQGLPQSALEQVNKIYEKAKKDNNPAQLVKAVVHKLKFQASNPDYDFAKNIEDLKVELEQSEFPVKPVLHSMLAEMYANYYQQNRYRFDTRTATENLNETDLRTWDLHKLSAEITKNYQLSLEDTEKLQQIPVNLYEAVLFKTNNEIPNGRTFRPTLYDFLAHRAIDFFMNEESGLAYPAQQFIFNNNEYFGSAEAFAQLKLETADTTSYKFHALKLLQDVISFHLQDDTPDSLVDVDLKRLAFVEQNSVMENKTELYRAALQKMEDKYLALPLSTEIAFQHATSLYQSSLKYNPLQPEVTSKNPLFQFDAKTAFEMCDKAISRFPESDGATNCKTLQSAIKAKNLQITTEGINLPDQPFLSSIQYKNIQKLYVKIIKTDTQELHDLKNSLTSSQVANGDYQQELVDFYTKKDALQTFTITLEDEGDYQNHSLEAKIPALPLGQYVILAGTNETFDYQSNAVAYDFIAVSRMAYIHRTQEDGSMDFYVMDRASGSPLKNVSVQMWKNKYDYNTSKYQDSKGELFTTNQEGYFKVPTGDDHEDLSFSLEFQNGDDHLSTKDLQSEYLGYGSSEFYRGLPYKEARFSAIRTFFFMDRAMYRPGQTIYFKGLVMESDSTNKIQTIKTNYPAHVSLRDVNGQQVAELSLVTNEYGTFSGTFTAPSNGLNGQMSIFSGDNSTYFSVEDYKRPKFEVTFDKVKDEFKLGDSIKMVGKATSYSGANVDQASVQYRVVRKARFPYWWFCWRGFYPTSPEVEITNGTTQTDENGAFEINFSALPDLSITQDSKPTFTYTVFADVTDINGETHSSSEDVEVGYASLVVNVEVPENVDESKPQEFAINTTNLSGEFQKAQGTITIHKLKSPDTAYQKPLWQRSDKILISKEEFAKTFPQHPYADEENFFTWEKETKVFDKPFDTATTKTLKFEKMVDEKGTLWPQGKYVLEIFAKDKNGEEVKEVSYFTVYDVAPNIKVPYPMVDWFNPIKITGEPGEYAQILVGSSLKTKALYELEQDGKIIHKEWIALDNNTHLLNIPLKEEYRGNIGLHYTFVVNNRLYQHDETIIVPYTNKMLDLVFETFRDKLEPGQKEEWRIKIKGKNGDKVAAEMVAALYDASLDAFRANSWDFNIFNSYYASLNWESRTGFALSNATTYSKGWNSGGDYIAKYYDIFNWYDFIFGYSDRGIYYPTTFGYEKSEMAMGDFAAPTMAEPGRGAVTTESAIMKDGEAFPGEYKKLRADSTTVTNEIPPTPPTTNANSGLAGIQTRTNFNETAFFYPHLKTDANGEIIIAFTVPQALTRWKMLGFAHTKDLKYGLAQNELVTQKDLMVVSNPPRFFREGDKITFPAKISSLADKDLKGQVELQLFDALTMKPLTTLLKDPAQKTFEVKAKQSTNISWNLEIPEGVDAITYKVVAQAANFSDGEEMTVPVLTNRTLVTETLPLPIRDKTTKTFTFDKLLNNTSTTLKNHKLTLEYTSNPAWYAVQALPYLMEYPYECAEQTFSRFYANSLASHIANSNPKIKQVFDSWKNSGSDALLSNLEKNQELKSLLLEETPWVRDAQNETEQKHRIALLFDLNTMSNQLDQNLTKLVKMQVSNGAWPWFEGMPEDRYITQHIVTGMGKLDHLGVKEIRKDERVWTMTIKAVGYLDGAIKNDYDELKRQAAKGEIKLEENHLNEIQIQYLYARSFFKDIVLPAESKEAVDYFKGQAIQYWVKQNGVYMQGMIALALYRDSNTSVPMDIVKSLKEHTASSEEMGMYFNTESGYFWYQAPIETQALMIEVFDEVAKDSKAVDDLKVWLLKQKQTQNWKTTKATSEAIYALLLRGTDWLASDALVEITVGSQKIDPKTMDDVKVEAGTGYFKTSWPGAEINKDMGNITITKKDDGVAWGAMYWQYFEDLDKITSAATPLQLKKQLFLQKNTENGPVITPLDDATTLQVGDLVKVRIELRVDRDMEYVHMKDMRASTFEPLNTLSGYKFQDGLGYYESTRDAATNFFFGRLSKGTYVFEYPLRVSYEGDFSNGITTIESMYAPEFTSHSEGQRVIVN